MTKQTLSTSPKPSVPEPSAENSLPAESPGEIVSGDEGVRALYKRLAHQYEVRVLRDEAQSKEQFDDEGVRDWYKRLAREYKEHEPIVPDCGGGAPGDLYDL